MAIINSPLQPGVAVTELTVNNVMGMLVKDLAILMSGADIDLKYPEFERTYGEWGAMITEGRVPAAEGRTVDKNATGIPATAYWENAVRYYQKWTEAEYPSEIRRIDLTKICRGEADYNAVLAAIARRNIEGYQNDVNHSIESAFINTEATMGVPDSLVCFDDSGASLADCMSDAGSRGFNGFLNATSAIGGEAKDRYEIIPNATYADVYAKLLYIAKKMAYANAAFTEGDDVYGAKMSDLSIWMPIDFTADADIKYMQTLYQMVGINKLPEIREYNTDLPITYSGGTKQANIIFIMDKRVLNHVPRYFETETEPILARHSTFSTLHVEHMTKYAPYYKAYALVFDKPTA